MSIAFRVRVIQPVSQCYLFKNGVPQGPTLGALIPINYANDLPPMFQPDSLSCADAIIQWRAI